MMLDGERRLSGARIHGIRTIFGRIERAFSSLGGGGRSANWKVPFANGHRRAELTRFCPHSTVMTVNSSYEPDQDSGRAALEEGRDRRHLPRNPPLFRSFKHHGRAAQVRRRGRSAGSRKGRARKQRANDARVFAGPRRGILLRSVRKCFLEL